MSAAGKRLAGAPGASHVEARRKKPPKPRKDYVDDGEFGFEETPVCDIPDVCPGGQWTARRMIDRRLEDLRLASILRDVFDED